MNKKMFIFQEAGGFLATIFTTVLMWNIYDLSQGAFPSALFGSVNFSIWEQMKPMLLGYILYALVEIITSKPYFKQFVVAKFIGVYGVLLCYIALRCLLSQRFGYNLNIITTIIALGTGYLLSYKLTVCDYSLKTLFPTACFMILLLFVLCFSFTAFPPKGMLFVDPETNLYGIIPDYIDVGAIVLNNMYY